MWPDRVSNPGPLALESNMLPTVLSGLELVVYINHSVLTRCIMNRKLPMRNSNLHDNPQTYTNFCGKIVCFSLLWWNKSSILLIFGKALIVSIVSTYFCPKLEQINHFK